MRMHHCSGMPIQTDMLTPGLLGIKPSHEVNTPLCELRANNANSKKKERAAMQLNANRMRHKTVETFSTDSRVHTMAIPQSP